MLRFNQLLAAIAILSGGLAFAADPVNINDASAEQLADIAIVAYRERHGPFSSVDELVEVQGIGERTVERSRENLTVGPPAKP